jgi:hypothetical protein
LLLLASLTLTAPFDPEENRQLVGIEESVVLGQNMDKLLNGTNKFDVLYGDCIEDVSDSVNDFGHDEDANYKGNDFDDELLRRRRLQKRDFWSKLKRKTITPISKIVRSELITPISKIATSELVNLLTN